MRTLYEKNYVFLRFELVDESNQSRGHGALEQARNFDRSGQESQCMDAIAQAKGLMR